MTGRAFTVGVFDGVHLGHRRVLATLLRLDDDPLVLIGRAAEESPLLTSAERRVELLRELGIRRIDVSAGDGWDRAPDGDAVFVGGDAERARGLSRDRVVVVPPVAGVSAERVRQLVRVRDLGAAAQLLGRPIEVEGVVVEGAKRGRLLGFPTANLDVPPELLVPPNGIYAGAALGHRAAISIGTNPHYGGRERTVEAFLLDFDGDLYGRALRVEVWRHLRDEAAFGSEQELVAQIARDVEAARTALRPS